ncbi:lumican [Cricetulus griseus]
MNMCAFALVLALICGVSGQYYDYDAPLFMYGQLSPNCAPECNCPHSYPTAMYCDDLKLKSVPMVPPGIKYLYLRNNQIDHIDEKAFENVTDLQWLILDHNLLENSKIKGKVFSKLKQLKKLHINYNNLTESVGPLPKSLQDLQLTHNKISKLGSFEGLANLTFIHLQYNQLKEDAVSASLKGLKSLEYLDLSFNQIAKLPSGLPASLLTLYLDSNKISNIPDEYFKRFTGLQYLRLSHNQLADSGVPGNSFNISSLLELDLSYNKLKSIPTVNENLENYYLEVNELEKFDVKSFCKILGPLSYSKIKHLRLDGNPLTQSNLPPDMECFCPPSFPTALYCENRGLREIPAIPSRIWYLYLENNQIETIPEKPFQNATQLRWINLNKNKITNYGIEKGALSQLKKLLFLFLEDNELEEVPSPLPRSLEQLQLARNKVSRIPQGTFSNLENLTLLDLQHNKLLDNAFQRDTFKGLKNLMQLNMAKNALRNMPPRLPANTMQLFLDNNSIEAIPENYFNVIPKVAFLRLNHNKLSDAGLPSKGFDVSSILDLQLSHNQLTNFPRINANLQHLHLDHNKIKNVNISVICPTTLRAEQDAFIHGPQLSYLRLDGNEIKPPIPIDIVTCFKLLQAFII